MNAAGMRFDERQQLGVGVASEQLLLRHQREIEPAQRRSLLALLATLTPLEEDFPEIDDPVPAAENVL